MATKVSLRQKKISKGRKSLYLDFHPAIPHPKPFLNKKTGKMVTTTRREFLGLYIYEKAKTPINKQHNTEILKIGESIRQKRENFLNKPEIYSQFEKEQLRLKELSEQCFIEYFTKLANKRKDSNRLSWFSALKYLDNFTNGSLKFADLNQKFLEDFKEYLLTTKSNKSNKTTLSQNSAVSYFNKVKAALKQANIDGVLQYDLNAKVKPIKAVETRREHLTLDELNKLVKTPCNYVLLKRAALFSALTGLRFSDIQKMTWGELEYINGQGYFLNFNQKKTKGVEVLPISEQAYGFTEGAENPKDMPQDKHVLEGLKYSAYNNKHLFQWIGAAGITKDITFHCFRHTFATLQLFNGTDIYTVSKMLGHKDLKTTQVYAKIVDEAKRTAANKIKLDM
jgi:integrase